jgi:hypothetical protein
MRVSRSRKRIVLIFLCSVITLQGALAAAALLMIPPDPKNAWLLGYSKTRWMLVIIMFGITVIFGFLSFKSLFDNDWGRKWLEKLERWIRLHGGFFLILWAFFIPLFFGPYLYLMNTPTIHLPITRLAPMIWWGLLVSVELLAGVLMLKVAVRREVPEGSSEVVPLRLNPGTILLYLGSVSVVLVILSTSSNLLNLFFGDPKLFHYIRKLYLNGERTIPTYYSSVLLLIAACLVGSIAVLRKREGGSYVFHWTFLSILFLLLSMDEVAGIHENMNRPMRLMLNPSGFFSFAWVILGIPVVLALGMFYVRFFMDLPAIYRIRFAIAGFLYVGGALGFEMITGRHFALYDNENIPYILLVTIEESLEIAGVLVFIWSLLVYLLDHYKESRFILKSARR